MNPVEIDELVNQLLSLSGRDQPGEIARVRARLADRLNEAADAAPSRTISAGEMAAFVDDALSQADRARLEAEIARSPDMLLELVDTLEFLKDVEERLEVAPDDLEPARASDSSLVAAIHAVFRHGTMLSAEQQRQLFADRSLRSEFAAIKQQYAQSAAPAARTGGWAGRQGFAMPSVAAAASDQPVNERAFTGGSVRIVKSSLGDMLVQFALEQEGPFPRALLLEGYGGVLGWTDLPPPDASGKILLIKDMGNAEHAEFVRLLQDPRSQGTFLK
jgi:hypothetical protein